MPGLSGIALAEQIMAARVPGRAVEVVLLTGEASRDEVAQAMRAGAFDLLLKGGRLDDIVAVLRRAMARALERRSAALAAEQERIALQALYSAAPIGLGLVGHGLRLDRANPALVELLGLPEGAALHDLWGPCRRRARRSRSRCGASWPAATCPPAPSGSNSRRRTAAAAIMRRVLNLHVYPVAAADGSGEVFAAGLACLDVTAETILLRELDHRVKNAYASFLGLVRATARTSANQVGAGHGEGSRAAGRRAVPGA